MHLALSIVAFIAVLAVAVSAASIAFSNSNGIGYGMPEIAASLIVTIMVSIIIWFICITIIGIIEIILEYHLSKTYNFDGLFTVGLLLMPVVFYTILGVKCIKSGVLNRIPTGRKVFIAVCVVLLIALTVIPLSAHII